MGSKATLGAMTKLVEMLSMSEDERQCLQVAYNEAVRHAKMLDGIVGKRSTEIEELEARLKVTEEERDNWKREAEELKERESKRLMSFPCGDCEAIGKSDDGWRSCSREEALANPAESQWTTEIGTARTWFTISGSRAPIFCCPDSDYSFRIRAKETVGA